MSDVDVAVVGGGPAGIAAAVALRRRGVERIVILERERQVGGVPRHCGHPPFGMREFGRVLTGPAYARRLEKLASDAGVSVRTATSVVALHSGGALDLTTADGPAQLSARRVLLATGVREMPRSARLVSGDRAIGILTTGALQDYIYLKKLLPFRNPVVVGTELVSLSALWTCIAAGIRPAALIERDERPTARWPLTLFPRVLGMATRYATEIVDISGADRVRSVTLRDAAGNLSTIACDGVLFTGRFVPEASLVRASHIKFDPATGGPEIDQTGRCSDPAYYAAGNVLHPVETAGWCFREGERVAEAMARDLAQSDRAAPESVRVIAQPPIRFVVPQRLVPGEGAAFPYLQLRADQAARGRLAIVGDGGRPLWERRVALRPERRILISTPSAITPSGRLDIRLIPEKG